jgi:hypothetical protein
VEQAFLLVRRHVKDPRPLEGKETTITIELYNSGSRWGAGLTAGAAPAAWSCFLRSGCPVPCYGPLDAWHIAV